MKIPERLLQEIKERVSLADVVGRHVSLKRNGGEAIGLCPFHTEKTPSFTVSEAKGFYHCFGCGAHGSVIDFVMNYERVSFREAVKALGAGVGLDIPYSDDGDSSKNREHAEILERATAFFQDTLHHRRGDRACAYLKSRNINSDMIALFRLGYADNDYVSLRDFLLAKGHGEQAIVDAGLCALSSRTNRIYDRFRGRLMFPIINESRRTIAFGGRLLDAGEPKYLNSPETDVFKKSQTLYHPHGVTRGASAARNTSDKVILVEGYLDVISITQETEFTGLSPLGTALSADQLYKAWARDREPILCFDGDVSGQRAAWRCLQRALPLLRPSYGLKFAMLPEKEDPDSFLRRYGADAFSKLIADALPISVFLWRQEIAKAPLKSAEQRVAVWKNLCDSIKIINDRAVRSEFRNMYYKSLWPDRNRTTSRRGTKVSISAHRKADDAGVRSEQKIVILGEDLLRFAIANFENFDRIEKDFCDTVMVYPQHEYLRQRIIYVWSNYSADSSKLEEHILHLIGTSAGKYVEFANALKSASERSDEEAVKRDWAAKLAAYKIACSSAPKNTHGRNVEENDDSRFACPYRIIREAAAHEEL